MNAQCIFSIFPHTLCPKGRPKPQSSMLAVNTWKSKMSIESLSFLAEKPAKRLLRLESEERFSEQGEPEKKIP